MKKKPKIWQRLSRLVLALVFAAAACSKLMDPGAFAAQIMLYRLTSQPIAAALALYVPWLEIMLAVALFWGTRWHRAAAGLSAALLTLFSFVILLTKWRGIDIDCGCFGNSIAIPLTWALVRNLGLIVCAVLILVLTPEHSKSQPSLSDPEK